MPTMDDAWEAFGKALKFDEKRAKAAEEGNENMARIAGKAIDRNLAEACRIEAEVIGLAQAA